MENYFILAKDKWSVQVDYVKFPESVDPLHPGCIPKSNEDRQPPDLDTILDYPTRAMGCGCDEYDMCSSFSKFGGDAYRRVPRPSMVRRIGCNCG